MGQEQEWIVDRDAPILVTGASGFIGRRVVENLLDRGFRNVRCFVRPISDSGNVDALASRSGGGTTIEIIKGSLLSAEDCIRATKDVSIIYHLAAGTGEKSFPEAFLHSVVSTRNLLDASLQHAQLRRFVLVSSFTVYTNCGKTRQHVLDESSEVEQQPHLRGEAYCFAKVKQEELVKEYSDRKGIPYVSMRPGAVYGPGKTRITGRVGVDTFGIFMHLGGSNTMPFTYVDNCADAIVLGGLVKGVDGEVFNVVDDDLPSSRQFLRLYKEHVRSFKSIYVPHLVSYVLCTIWEWFSNWSKGQLPPAFTRSRWHVEWKPTKYSNEKMKKKLGWVQKTSTEEGLQRYFKSCRAGGRDA